MNIQYLLFEELFLPPPRRSDPEGPYAGNRDIVDLIVVNNAVMAKNQLIIHSY